MESGSPCICPNSRTRTSSSRTAACGFDSSLRPASRRTSAATGKQSTSSNRASRPNNPSSTTHRQDREPLVLPLLLLLRKEGTPSIVEGHFKGFDKPLHVPHRRRDDGRSQT